MIDRHVNLQTAGAPKNQDTDASRDFALDAYDFEYPESLIAKQPAEPRDSARLLVLDRRSGERTHGRFRDLSRYLNAGDCLVLNRTKVWPARLLGRKSTGGKADLLLVREIEPGRWAALASGMRPGMKIHFAEDASAEIESLTDQGEYVCRFSSTDVLGLMSRCGLAPLPPYILKSRKSAGEQGTGDLDRYQTVYAREAGSIAAPTAGLHFTPELLERLRSGGVRIAEIVLHVGRGTFRPVTSEDIRGHRMLPEWYQVSAEALSVIGAAKREKRRIVTVGTTATRTMETIGEDAVFSNTSPKDALNGWTDLYIQPERRFRTIDALITNFHLPRSSPLVLASAFAGRKRLLAAYREAIDMGYRLYSYGDAMLIL